jgi:O-antigen/teichoic acid export membrane protein
MQFTGYLWLADFGVRESVVKYVAQYHASGQKDELLSTVRTAVSLYTLVALVAMLAVSALTFGLPTLPSRMMRSHLQGCRLITRLHHQASSMPSLGVMACTVLSTAPWAWF